VEIKCQLDAKEVFIADLIVCSTCFGHQYAHHQELENIVQWLLPMVFGAVVFQVVYLVWSWGLCVRFANRTHNPQHQIPQAATTVYYSRAPDDGHLLHLVGIYFHIFFKKHLRLSVQTARNQKSSMEKCPLSHAVISSANEEIAFNLWNPKSHYPFFTTSRQLCLS